MAEYVNHTISAVKRYSNVSVQTQSLTKQNSNYATYTDGWKVTHTHAVRNMGYTVLCHFLYYWACVIVFHTKQGQINKREHKYTKTQSQWYNKLTVIFFTRKSWCNSCYINKKRAEMWEVRTMLNPRNSTTLITYFKTLVDSYSLYIPVYQPGFCEVKKINQDKACQNISHL